MLLGVALALLVVIVVAVRALIVLDGAADLHDDTDEEGL